MADQITKILEERGSRYGKFEDHAAIVQTLKYHLDRFVQHRQCKLTDDQKESLDMILHKIGRIVNGDPNYGDSWRDIAGYATLVADRLEGVVR